ncbi:DUF4400 domain-containing protein [Thorsellia kenyensis]|uniref:DUF4400 domain-containing protein n=1 Tax=Thorsellia kenyensis TaxID=1549888 RepID=A0ABV6CDC3_9GAMM
MNKIFLIILLSLSLLVLCLLILGLSTEQSLTLHINEHQINIKNVLGDTTCQRILQKTNSDYQKLVIHSGLKKHVQHFFIPSGDEKMHSKGLETLGNSYFNWMNQRIELLSKLWFLVLFKKNVLTLFLPWLCVYYVALSIEGELIRRKKSYEFALPSALRFGFAIKAIIAASWLLLYVLILPYAWTLFLLLLLSLIVGFFSMLLFANANYR